MRSSSSRAHVVEPLKCCRGQALTFILIIQHKMRPRVQNLNKAHSFTRIGAVGWHLRHEANQKCHEAICRRHCGLLARSVREYGKQLKLNLTRWTVMSGQRARRLNANHCSVQPVPHPNLMDGNVDLMLSEFMGDYTHARMLNRGP